MAAERDRFRQLLEHAADAIFVHAADGGLTEVNRAACEMLGAEREALLGRHPSEFVVTHDRAGLQALWRDLVPGVPSTLDCELRRSDGRVLAVCVRLGVIEDDAGRTIIASCRDTTADRERARALEHEIAQRREAEEISRSHAETLAGVASALAGRPALDAFLALVLQAIAGRLHAEGAGMWGVDDDGYTVRPMLYFEGGRVVAPADSEHPAMRGTFDIRDEHPLVRELYQQRRPIVHDLATDDLMRPAFRAYLQGRGVTTVLNVPVLVGQRHVGFLTARRTAPERFSAEDVRLAQALANHAALALELTRLATQAQRMAVAEERARLARDVHDTLAQAFTAVIVQIEAARRAAAEPSALDRHLSLAAESARDGLTSAREAVLGVRNGTDHDLIEGLGRTVRPILAGSGVALVVTHDGVPRAVPAAARDALVGVAREAATNVVRHAAARQVHVTIAFAADTVTLRIQDDGRGFQEPGTGFGLTSMRERVEAVGGRWVVESPPGTGTLVTASVPAP